MILQEQTKQKYKSDKLSRTQLSDFFNNYLLEEQEYDIIWDEWFLKESVRAEKNKSLFS